MKVGIFGANGRTGVEVVSQCKKQGYEVAKFSGDIQKFASVDKFVAQCDTFISVVGHIKGSEKYMQTNGIGNIIKAMNKHGKSRLISLTGTGVRIEGDKPSLIDKLLNLSITIIDRDRVEDGKKHYEALKASNIDWTVIRVLKLTKKSKEQSFKLSVGGPAKILISRKTVAKIMVDQLESKTWSRKAPIVS